METKPKFSLPARPDLDHLRSQAKDLLKLAQQGDPSARDRIALYFPDSAAFRLTQAQLVVAREYGFASWNGLRAEVARRRGDSLLQEIVSAARGGRYDEFERLTTGEFFPRDPAARRVIELLQGRVSGPLPMEPIGPLNAPPLVYVCASRLLTSAVRQTAVRELLTMGADPNSFWRQEWNRKTFPLSVLYACVSEVDDPATAEILLQAGANPDDNESVYHACEKRDHVALRLLLRYGAKTEGTNALPHMLDYNDEEGVRILLAAGARMASLTPAVLRDCSLSILELLAEHGSDPVSQDQNLSGYEASVLNAKWAMTDWMRSRFSDLVTPPDLVPVEQALRYGVVRENLNLDPRYAAAVPLAGERGDLTGFRNLLALGFDPLTRDATHGAMAIHTSCFRAHDLLVADWLGRGLPWDVQDRFYEGWPLGWVMAGSAHCDDPEPAIRCVDQLVAAGHFFRSRQNPDAPNFLWMGHPAVKNHLRALGAID